MPNVVIYHKNCFDGFGAAWVARRVLDEADTTFVAATYGDAPPAVTESNVYIVDFSYPKEVMLALHAANKSLKVLDHHKTAQENCEGLDFCEFDLSRSGAGMAWDYFEPHIPRPPLINYIEDRDLWKFSLPHCKEVHAYIASWPKSFPVWDTLETELYVAFDKVVTAGASILRYHQQKIDEIVVHAALQQVGDYLVPVVNCNYQFASDVGNLLTEHYADSPFAATYCYLADGTKQYSLRGRNSDAFDVSAVAAQFGGGGHKKAAGFKVPAN